MQKTVELVAKKSYQLETCSTNIISMVNIEGNSINDYESFEGRKAKIRFIAGKQYLPPQSICMGW